MAPNKQTEARWRKAVLDSRPSEQIRYGEFDGRRKERAWTEGIGE